MRRSRRYATAWGKAAYWMQAQPLRRTWSTALPPLMMSLKKMRSQAKAGVLLADRPEALAKKLPRYPSVPTVRMGRLAVDQAFKGQGLGAALLADALRRAVTAEIAAYAPASAYQHKSNEGTDEGTAQSVALEPAPALDIWRSRTYHITNRPRIADPVN